MPILPNVQNIVGQGLAPTVRDGIGRTQERLRNGRRAWKPSPAAVRAEQAPPLQRRHQKTAASLSFRGTSNKAERRCALHTVLCTAMRFFALFRMTEGRNTQEDRERRKQIKGCGNRYICYLGGTVCSTANGILQTHDSLVIPRKRGISQTVRFIPLNETDGRKNRMDRWQTRERLSSS